MVFALTLALRLKMVIVLAVVSNVFARISFFKVETVEYLIGGIVFGLFLGLQGGIVLFEFQKKFAIAALFIFFGGFWMRT